jgi:hypothetical protein
MLKTHLCELLGLKVPIILAPMGTCTSVEPCGSSSRRATRRSAQRRFGTTKVMDYLLGHRGRVCSGLVTPTRRAEFRGGALENVGTATATADAADDA